MTPSNELLEELFEVLGIDYKEACKYKTVEYVNGHYLEMDLLKWLGNKYFVLDLINSYNNCEITLETINKESNEIST